MNMTSNRFGGPTRSKVAVPLVIVGALCAIGLFSLAPRLRENFHLWRLRANYQRFTGSQSPFDKKVDRVFSWLTLESPDALKDMSQHRTALVQSGRLCQKEFALRVHADVSSYKPFWEKLAQAAPGAHESIRSTGPPLWIVTNVQITAYAEDMPKVDRIIAEFNAAQ